MFTVYLRSLKWVSVHSLLLLSVIYWVFDKISGECKLVNNAVLWLQSDQLKQHWSSLITSLSLYNDGKEFK